MSDQPKKKYKAPRFYTRDQIIARIDKFTKKAAGQREKQRSKYAEAGQLRRVYANDDALMKKAKRLDDEGDKWGRKADRLEQDVLGKLKNKLSEFDTNTLPGVDIDKSIEGL